MSSVVGRLSDARRYVHGSIVRESTAMRNLSSISLARTPWLHTYALLCFTATELAGCGDDAAATGSSGGSSESTTATQDDTTGTTLTSESTVTAIGTGSESESGTSESGTGSESESGASESGTDTSDSGTSTDTGSSSDGSTGGAAFCGNGVVDLGELCDYGDAIDGDGCDAACAVEVGWICDEGDPCTPICGDALVLGLEQCDGANLGGLGCTDQGFDGGTLGCDPVTCLYDEASCFLAEALQNDNGNCNFNAVGCSDTAGTGGNPQTVFECYVSGLTPPIEIVAVEYHLEGVLPPVPDALDLVVHAWAGQGNPPGALLGSFTLDPLVDIVAGPYVFGLPTPVQSLEQGFCVGLHSENPADGFRVDISDVSLSGESYIEAPTCGAVAPAELSALGFPGAFCMRPTVHGH